MCMFFFGSIDFIMAGSDLKKVMVTIYAFLHVDKMLACHVYSLAVRDHAFL